MLSDELSEGLVRRLFEAERDRVPIAPLSDSYPDLSEEDAYRIQDGLVAAGGEGVIGYKLGFTSRAMREQMGISGPNHGRLTGGMRVDSNGARIELSRLIHPRVEPEVSLLIEHDLHGPGLLPVQVYPAIRWVFGALEVVDSRYRDYRFRAEDNAADNSSAARFVLGPPTALGGVPDLRLAGAMIWQNGRLLGRGIGADALGGPIDAVAWLANRLGEAGRKLEAGSIVLTGASRKPTPSAKEERSSRSSPGWEASKHTSSEARNAGSRDESRGQGTMRRAISVLSKECGFSIQAERL
ncbi:MAG: 2-keto-4-pentenoate hydratase, partial [Rubrobacteraceae bacterium]